MKNISIIAALVASVFSSAAYAECAGLSLNEANVCVSIEYKNADDTLNNVYRTLPKTDLLVSAELSWIDYRDSHCNNVSSPFRGRDDYYYIRTTCLTALTNQRTNALMNWPIE